MRIYLCRIPDRIEIQFGTRGIVLGLLRVRGRSVKLSLCTQFFFCPAKCCGAFIDIKNQIADITAEALRAFPDILLFGWQPVLCAAYIYRTAEGRQISLTVCAVADMRNRLKLASDKAAAMKKYAVSRLQRKICIILSGLFRLRRIWLPRASRSL